MRIGQLARTNLDAVDPHDAAFVLITVPEQDGRRQEGAPILVQGLISCPIVLLDAVHVFGRHRRMGGFIVGDGDAMPRARREGPGSVVAAGALAEVVALPKQVAVVGIIERTGLDEGGRARPRSVHHDVHHQSVLVDPGAAAIWRDAVVHDITDVPVQIARHLHDFGRFAVDVSDAQGSRGAEHGLGEGLAGGPIKVLQRFAEGGRQIALVEVPLPGHVAFTDERDRDGE